MFRNGYTAAELPGDAGLVVTHGCAVESSPGAHADRVLQRRGSRRLYEMDVMKSERPLCGRAPRKEVRVVRQNRLLNLENVEGFGAEQIAQRRGQMVRSVKREFRRPGAESESCCRGELSQINPRVHPAGESANTALAQHSRLVFIGVR